jgi:hypothetical protein
LKRGIGWFWAGLAIWDFRFGILDGRGGLGDFGREGDRFGILDLGFWMEEGDWEVLGVRAIDFRFEIWDFGWKRGIGRFWA